MLLYSCHINSGIIRYTAVLVMTQIWFIHFLVGYINTPFLNKISSLKKIGSFMSLTDLVSSRCLLHLFERGVKLANEVMLPSRVVIPHETLQINNQGQNFTWHIWFTSLRIVTCVSYRLVRFCTFNFLSSSQLHREMSETLNGCHTGFRLFLITWDKKIDIKHKRRTGSVTNVSSVEQSDLLLFCVQAAPCRHRSPDKSPGTGRICWRDPTDTHTHMNKAAARIDE